MSPDQGRSYHLFDPLCESEFSRKVSICPQGTSIHTGLKGQHLTSCQFSCLCYPLDSKHASFICRIVNPMEIEQKAKGIRQAAREPGQQGTGDQESRESGGKQQWNIEYRTRNIQCRSATWCPFDCAESLSRSTGSGQALSKAERGMLGGYESVAQNKANLSDGRDERWVLARLFGALKLPGESVLAVNWRECPEIVFERSIWGHFSAKKRLHKTIR